MLVPVNEAVIGKYKMVESVSANLPEGVLCKIDYPICRIGKKNRNGRVYEQAVWDRVIKSSEIREKIDNRCLFGQAEHPKTTQSNLEKTSHIITGTYIKEGTVFQTFEVLDTPYGRIIDTLLRAGCAVPVSTRAEGELVESEDADGKYMSVVSESYDYRATDFTADPSTISPYPESIQRNIVSQVGEGLKDHTLDTEFATCLLESIECEEAKTLLESVSKKEVNEDFCPDCNVKCDLDDGMLKCPEADCKYTKVADVDDEETQEDIGEFDIKADVIEYSNNDEETDEEIEETCDEDDIDKIEKTYESEELVFSNLDDMAIFIRNQLDSEVVPNQLKEFVQPTVVKAVSESNLPEFTIVCNGVNGSYVLDPSCNEAKKLFKSWYFENSSGKSHKIDAPELVEAHAKSCDQCQKYLTENNMFGNSDVNDFNRQIKGLNISEAVIRAEKEAAIESADAIKEELSNILSTKIIETAILTNKISRFKDIAESRGGKINEYREEIKTTMVQLAVALEKCDILEGKIKDGSKDIKKHKDKASKNLVEAYVGWITESRNLTLTESSLALLKNCKTTEEVDSILDTIVDGLRENALHSMQTPLAEVIIENSYSDSDKAALNIGRSVASILKFM